MTDYDGLRGCVKCGNDTLGRLCTSCAHQEMIDNYDGDYDYEQPDQEALESAERAVMEGGYGEPDDPAKQRIKQLEHIVKQCGVLARGGTKLVTLDEARLMFMAIENMTETGLNSEPASRQVMDAATLRNWLLALDIPNVTDIFQPNAPNLFYVSFHKTLFPDDYRKIKALGLDAISTDIRARYMVRWNPPQDEES